MLVESLMQYKPYLLSVKNGGGDVVLNSDEGLTRTWYLPAAPEAKYTCHTWSPEAAQE